MEQKYSIAGIKVPDQMRCKRPSPPIEFTEDEGLRRLATLVEKNEGNFVSPLIGTRPKEIVPIIEGRLGEITETRHGHPD